ncbi:hypothetical protein E2C01_017166 [Portunus trituberculatus]|uniref:Uncharacterized protein n=1 Tax=Portunus trituberculatus TaxID=210409 RepID=A0A5B7DS67_PORTR|nr:hypothetical protein [Portunus trituberculatus]
MGRYVNYMPLQTQQTTDKYRPQTPEAARTTVTGFEPGQRDTRVQERLKNGAPRPSTATRPPGVEVRPCPHDLLIPPGHPLRATLGHTKGADARYAMP